MTNLYRMFRIGRRHAVVVALGALTLAALAPPSPSLGAGKVPALGGRTRIVATKPSTMKVRVPAAASIATPFEASPDVRVTGNGDDLTFFALVEQDSDPFVLVGGRLPRAAGGTTFAQPLSSLPERTGWNYGIAKNYGAQTEIPAGNYRLYVHPGAQPAAIELSFDGLPGRTGLRPRSAAKFETENPPARVPTAGSLPNLYSAGMSETLTSEGLIFSALWLQTEAFAAGQFQFCHYEEGTEIEPIAYGPGCPNAHQSTIVNDRRPETGETRRVLFGGKSALAPGPHGQGFWYAAEGAVKDMGYTSLWLSYR